MPAGKNLILNSNLIAYCVVVLEEIAPFQNIFFSFSGGMAESVKSDSEKRSYEFDNIFEHVSSFGRYQKILYFCSCLLVFPVTNQFSLLVFGFGTPDFHCVTPNVTCDPKKCCDGCTSYEFDGPFHSTVSEVGIALMKTFW